MNLIDNDGFEVDEQTGKEYKTVTFDISGDYITELVRSWFYKEGKPYEVVEELLLDCLVSDSLSIDQRKEIASNIIIGKQKLTGNTRNDTYGVEDDNVTLSLFKTLTNTLKSSYKRADEAEAQLDKSYKSVRDFSTDGDDLLDNFLKAQRYNDNYGWLSPQGEFYPSDFGDHQDWADDYVNKNRLKYEYMDYNEKLPFGCGSKGDFLVYAKGFVLLHNPTQGLAMVTSSSIKPLTKRQKDFLYGYYIDRDQQEEAEKYLD